MSFDSRSRDDLFCPCGEPLTLEEYRRFGLCEDCEVEQAARRIPDSVPEWMGREAA